MSPGQYGRVFTVVESVFPDDRSVSVDANVDRLQTLRGMLGPLVCRTATEQERFGPVFDAVMSEVAPKPPPPDEDNPTKSTGPRTGEAPPHRWGRIGLVAVAVGIGLAALLYTLFNPPPPPPPAPIDSCAVDFRVRPARGSVVTFENRSPGVVSQLLYVWDFGDGTPTVTSSQTLVQHTFSGIVNETALSRVTLRGAGCPPASKSAIEPVTLSTYSPSPLPFLRLPETSHYTLSGWVPLLLMLLGGLLGGGWWLARRRKQQQQTAQRPTTGPFFLSFPPQDDAIQPSPSLLSWAQQLQQREESERHMLAVGPTIQRTIRNGGMPVVQYETIKRRPRYLILIDARSAYDQQAKLYAYVMSILVARNVDMDVFFFHSDPRYCWNENYPKGLPISDVYRLYSTHYLVLVTEGARLLDYDTGEVTAWAVEALGGWSSRALLTPVYPANWHYLEAALSRFFILLPATPDGQFLLYTFLGKPDSVPSFEELLERFRVLPGTPNRGLFGIKPSQTTLADVRRFLSQAVPGPDKNETVREWLFRWACATAVFPTPDWAMTLAIGRAIERHFKLEELVTSTNILKLTALPWLRQDHIPEPLRSNLLAELPPEVETVARKTAVRMLKDLKPSAGSVAFEEQQLRLWEQEYHLGSNVLPDLKPYRPFPDLIKDASIRQRLARQQTVETRWQSAGVLLLLLLPLLLYITPPRTQVAGVLVPFFRQDSSATDSAAYYNNRAVRAFNNQSGDRMTLYGQGILDLFTSIRHRQSFEAVYNLNVSRYNLAILRQQQAPKDERTSSETRKAIQSILSPFGDVNKLMSPFGLFDPDWVPDSLNTRQYLWLLAQNAPNDTLFSYVERANQTSVNEGQNTEVGIRSPIDQLQFNSFSELAKGLFRRPGTLEISRSPQVAPGDTLSDTLLSFATSRSQRDSLISLEAARVVFYLGGPKRAAVLPLATFQGLSSESDNTSPTAGKESSGSTGGGWPDKPTARSNAIRKTTKRPRITARATAPQNQENVASPVKRAPRPMAYPVQVEPDTLQSQPASPSSTTPAKTTEQTNLPATTGNDNVPTYQQQQVAKPQEPDPIDESTLEEVYNQTTQCTGKSDLSFALPKQAMRPIKLFEVVKLSDSPNLNALTVYCNGKPETLYSKRDFSHVKVFVSRNNSIIWSFLRESRKAAK